MAMPNCNGDWEMLYSYISQEEKESLDSGKKVADSAARLPSPPSPLYVSIAPDISL